jgi:hypothetical protein
MFFTLKYINKFKLFILYQFAFCVDLLKILNKFFRKFTNVCYFNNYSLINQESVKVAKYKIFMNTLNLYIENIIYDNKMKI